MGVIRAGMVGFALKADLLPVKPVTLTAIWPPPNEPNLGIAYLLWSDLYVAPSKDPDAPNFGDLAYLILMSS